jgi:hypothetical protein
MKVITFLMIVAILLTGCGVATTKAVNWHPYDSSRDYAHYECLRESQQVESRASFGAGTQWAAGSARTSVEFNKTLLNSCMQARGYQLRPMTGTELIITLITSPLAISFAILGVDVSEFY